MKVVKDTVDYREKNNVIRKDFMHLLLQLKNKGEITAGEEVGDVKANHESDQPFLTMNEMAAQCFVFFLAGFETSSTTMTFALLELAQNQEIQDKLRDEIRSVLKKNDNKLTYEDVMEMTYLDKVVNENIHQPPVTGRVCNKEYHVPGTDVVIEPGTGLYIPIASLQSDPEYYPNPDVFDPERFSEENKAKRPPCTFIPFGDGPRMCIGMRFGVMQSKVGLIKVIKNFRVTLNEKTITPIKLESRTAIASVKGDVWLNIAKTD
ncbi:hypothetical protein NQ318_010660 [Aromia moschata]|uniref:Cytochrome P450 n=1 Tax=Aromia moschata TaxID=1265417 RepID=A0AAV8XUT6_9CUCU|nr:hypothetical protein NQ318_010660 [Aromia moschata]